MISLPRREGPRPTTSEGIPHRQLDQNSPRDVHEEVVRRFEAVADAKTGPSTISVPGALALFLECEGCADASVFLRDKEFAHVHPAVDGSFHAVLSPADCEAVLEQGWGELHPWAVSGRIQPNVVMIYAPRSLEEIDVAMRLVEASKAHAKGAAAPESVRVGA